MNVNTKNLENDLCGKASLSESKSTAPSYILSFFFGICALIVVAFSTKCEVKILKLQKGYKCKPSMDAGGCRERLQKK